MKITRHITTMLFKATISLLTLAFVACKSEIETSLTDTDTLEFGVNLIMLPDTRTHLGDKTDNHYELLWSAGDKISVNGYQSEEVPNEYVNSVNATFTVPNMQPASSYSVVYPSSVVDSEDYTKIHLPFTYCHTETGIPAGSSVAVAKTSDSQYIHLKHICGFLRVTINDNENSSYPKVMLSIPGAALAGEFEVNYESASITPIEGVNQISISDVIIKDGKAEIVFPLPAGEYSDLVVHVYDGNKCLRKVVKKMTIQSGRILNVPAVDYNTLEQETYTGQGKVLDATTGKGIAGISVSDGYTVTKTDANGVYRIPLHSDARFIYYSTPSGYDINLNQSKTPDFYSKIADPTQVNIVDFHLTPSDNGDNFTLIGVGDPQCSSNSELNRYTTETIADIVSTTRNAGYKNVVAVTLGDVTFDSNNLYESLKNSMSNVAISGNDYIPFFQTIGNHDHDGLSQTDPTGLFQSHFGPTDYSFNVGKAHIVVMDNVYETSISSTSKPNGKKWDYQAGYTEQQYNWLRADLSNVENPQEKLLIFCGHIPFRAGGSNNGSNVNTDKFYSEVLSLMTQFNEAHIMIGHTHYSQNWIHANYKCQNGKPVYEHIHGAASGAWWSTYNTDKFGGPSGYSIYSIEGNSIVDWTAKGTGRPAGYQMRVFDGNKMLTGTKGYKLNWYTTSTLSLTDECKIKGNENLQNAFVVQIWDDDSDNWKVELRQNDAKVGDFTRLADKSCSNVWASSFFYNEANKKTDPYCGTTASHYWYFKPSNNVKPSEMDNWSVVATFTNPYSGKVKQYKCDAFTTDYSSLKQQIGENQLLTY